MLLVQLLKAAAHASRNSTASDTVVAAGSDRCCAAAAHHLQVSCFVQHCSMQIAVEAAVEGAIVGIQCMLLLCKQINISYVSTTHQLCINEKEDGIFNLRPTYAFNPRS